MPRPTVSSDTIRLLKRIRPDTEREIAALWFNARQTVLLDHISGTLRRIEDKLDAEGRRKVPRK